MSKNFKKYFINNLKETTYLSSIDRVEFDSTKTDGNDMLSDSQLQKRREKLDDVQIRDRHNNMRIYVKNLIDFRLGQLFTFVIPAALTVGTVASFIAPYRRVTDKDFSSKIVKESTILSDTEGQIMDNSEIYYYDNGFFSLNEDDFVKSNEYNYQRETNYNNLTYQISDGIDSMIAKFSYNSEGKLTFNNVDVGQYIDLNDYNFNEAVSIDEKYEKLFDEVLDLILSEEDISSDVKAKLESIANSEERKTIIDIVKYENIGSGVTEVYKNRFWQRTLLLIVTGFWWALVFALFKAEDMSKGTKLYAYNGRLCTEDNKTIGFWHVGLKYKEAFIRAEAERIKKAQDLAQEYVKDEDVSDLFTSFEKNLVLGNKRER